MLGNHDLTLIATARGFKKIKVKDNTQQVFDAIDGDELIDWLRRQPLCLFPNDQTILTHAGIPCIWTAEKTAQLAQEVQLQVANQDLNQLDAFFGGNVRRRTHVVVRWFDRHVAITCHYQLFDSYALNQC